MRLSSHKVLSLVGLIAVACGAAGCCTSAKCLDSKSGIDRVRVKAKRIALGVVHNDRVSAPARDRTDWKYVELPRSGKLTVQLHWDNGRSILELAVFDVIGVRIQEGRAWGAGGRRAVVAIEEAGRYYIRVRAKGKRDESHYSLRTHFREERSAKAVCHPCVVGDRKCLGESQYLVCEQLGPNCNAWAKAISCPAGAPCNGGVCGECKPQCSRGERRCSGRKAFQECNPTASGCLVWSEPQGCRRRCRSGSCVGGAARPVPLARTKPKSSGCSKARIISMYMFRGRMTLHLELGDAKGVKPGNLGHVLLAGSEKRVPGGEIKILRLVGARYAMATTSLSKLGNNRWVCVQGE